VESPSISKPSESGKRTLSGRYALLALGDADPVRLTAAERRDWGTCYAGNPQVTAVRVAAAHEALCLSGRPLTVAA
jgi:hypothetical protein